MEHDSGNTAHEQPLAVGLAQNQRPWLDNDVLDSYKPDIERILRTSLRHVPLNPMADLWQVLIEQGCPFLKRELLRKNPSRVPGVAAWWSLVGGISSSSRDVIVTDLEAQLKNRSP